MFGTIATMRPKPGQEAAVAAAVEEWWVDRQPAVSGARALHLYRSLATPGEVVMTVVFQSRAEYEANANDPAQGVWYEALLTLLEDAPSWSDGDVLVSHSA